MIDSNLTARLCQRLSKSSSDVAKWLLRQPGVKEESLTDWLLDDISTKSQGAIRYHAFNRHEEAKFTGADWEWWFLLPSYSIKYWIQAKKLLADGEDNYGGLAHSNKYGLQIEKLRQASQNVNAIPLYALYSVSSSASLCRQGRGKSGGVFIAGANSLHQKFIQKPVRPFSTVDLVAQSVPLSCFACCPLVRADETKSFLNTYFALEGEPPFSGEVQRGIHRSLPDYVEFLLRQGDHPVSFDWEREFRNQLPPVDALVVSDLRRPAEPK